MFCTGEIKPQQLVKIDISSQYDVDIFWDPKNDRNSDITSKILNYSTSRIEVISQITEELRLSGK